MRRAHEPFSEDASRRRSLGAFVQVLGARLVQVYADDVVLAAGLCKPNAAGSHELGSFEALAQRQFLKARGAFLAETVALGVTPLHVHALGLFLGRRVVRTFGCWPCAELYATPVDVRGDSGDPAWPALLLTDSYGRPHAELRLLDRDDDAWELLVTLTCHQVPRIR